MPPRIGANQLERLAAQAAGEHGFNDVVTEIRRARSHDAGVLHRGERAAAPSALDGTPTIASQAVRPIQTCRLGPLTKTLRSGS